MKRRNVALRTALYALTGISLFFGCGNIQTTKGSVALNITAINANPGAGLSVVDYGSSASSLASLAISPAIDSQYRSWSIVSGPPDAMKIYVISIQADGNNGTATLFQSPSPTGTELDLTSGNINLAAAGISAQSIPAGNYHQLDITVARVGQFKGCLTGTFVTAYSNTGTMPSTSTDYANYAGLIFTSESMAAGTYSFCTISSRSEVSVYTYTSDTIGSNADFEAQITPQFVDVDLQGSNFDNKTPSQITTSTLSMSFPADFTVTAGTQTPTTLTVAIDLNRMLRYFANTRTDFNPPNPDMKAGTSYFFTTVFQDSFMVFAGSPGSIEGYLMDADTGSSGVSPGGGNVVRAWMTLIKDNTGTPIAGIIMPDDDNILTIYKGSIIASSITPGTAGAVNIPFSVGISGGGSSGELVNFKYKNVGDPEDSCILNSLQNLGQFTVYYTRQM